MTREEAKEALSVLKIYDNQWLREAIDMAIEALQVKTDGDTISRQDALKPFCIAPDGTRIPEVDCDNFPVEFSVEFIKKHLLSLPSADRPTGEWVFVEEFMGINRYKCSACEREELRTHLSNFCPNCGAKMKGGDDE